VKLGKRLKKNNVAVDVVNFGEEAENTEKLAAFLGAVGSNDNSHLVTVPAGPHILSDILLSSPIITGAEGMTSSGSSTGGIGSSAASGGSDFGGLGFDPNTDPELALALKVSMEEERARQDALKKSESSSDTSAATALPSQPEESIAKSPAVQQDAMVTDEDDLLQQALQMSMPQPQTSNLAPAPQQKLDDLSSAAAANLTPASSSIQDVEMQDADDEEEMAKALSMSLLQPASSASSSTSADVAQIMEDPNFVNSVLSTLPGVDPNDERIKSVLESLKSQDREDKNKKK